MTHPNRKTLIQQHIVIAMMNCRLISLNANEQGFAHLRQENGTINTYNLGR